MLAQASKATLSWECADLALRFSKGEDLRANDLGKLRKCIDERLRKVTEAPTPGPRQFPDEASLPKKKQDGAI